MSDAPSSGKNELLIDVSTEENVQFMDQPLRGKIDLSGLTAPIESVSISLKGVVKTCVAGNAAWASGFGGDSNMLTRFTEKEVLLHSRTMLIIDSETRVWITSMYTTCSTSCRRNSPFPPLRFSLSRHSKSTA